MTKVMLHTYCDEIENLIDQGSLDAAISHCQHILKIRPKCLRVYSLIGKAALEKNDLKAAADLFSRSLCMDPEDFVARVGMSIASDKDGTLEQAVWHMERAFELVPDNQVVMGELRRLYGRRDGVEPEKVPLTRGALARLYARGNLYSQAINVFRRLLQVEPERVDLQVALAETLWRANRRIEAAETSLVILEKLPYCLKANLVLGEIWSNSGREEEGMTHLKRAQQIDPENETAQAMLGDRSPLPLAEVRIGRMEYVAPPAPIEQEPDWLQALVQDGAGLATTDEAVPDWLQAVAASAKVEATPQADVPAPEAEHVPDWLQDVAATAEVDAKGFAATPAPAAPVPDESEMPDWLSELTAEPVNLAEPLATEEIPGWLEDVSLLTDETEAVPTDVPKDEQPETIADDAPDWLAEMTPTEAEEPEIDLAGEELDVAGDAPDWLAEMTPTEAEEPEMDLAGEELDVAGDVPDWLAEMTPTEAEGEPELAAGELPDWLTEAAPIAEELAGAEELAQADIPGWLAEMAPPKAAPSVVPDLDVAPADVPDWLAEATPSEEKIPTAEPVEEKDEPSPALVAADSPDWLSELVQAAGATMEEDKAPADSFAEPEQEDLPEWLAGLQEEQPPQAEIPSGPIVIEEPEKETLVYPEGAGGEVTEAEADMLAQLEDMSPEDAFAAWEAMLAESEAEEAAPAPEAELPQAEIPSGPIVIEEPEKETLVYPEGADEKVSEADLLAQLEDMSPEDAFAAWEAMLAESEAEEAAPAPEAELPQAEIPSGPIVIEEPEKETLVYPEGAGGEVTEAEADMLAQLEDMSPEDAFAAWEAMLAESEEEEAAPAPEAELPQAEIPSGPIVIEEPEKETLVYPEGADEKVTEAEADMLAQLEDMSPEDAFAAWEAMLAESEAEEAAPAPEAELPQAEIPSGPIVIEEPEKETSVYPEGADEKVTEADLLAQLEDMSPEDAFAAWEAMLAESEAEEAAPAPEAELPQAEIPSGPIVIEEPEKETLVYPEGADEKVTEADLLAQLEDMSPEDAFAAWEAMLAESEAEEAAPAPEAELPQAEIPSGPIVIEEPEKETLVYPEGAEEKVSEADLLAQLEDMSPEDAFAAWEAMLAESEAEEAAPAPEAELPQAEIPSGPIVIEEPEKETLVYPEGAEEKVSEADLLAQLEDMSPEDAFAAWEAMLAESEAEEAALAPEAELPQAEIPSGPIVIEEPEKETLVYPEGADEKVSEADLLAQLEDMSPEDAFAAWEAMLAKGEAPVLEEEAPVAKHDQAWMPLVGDEVMVVDEEAIVPLEALPVEPVAELDQAWMPLAEDEVLPKEELPAEPVAEFDQAWMPLAEDEVLSKDEFPAKVTPGLAEEEALLKEEELEVEVEVAPMPEEAMEELPAWVVAQATEAVPAEDMAVGPDWVLLSESEETEIKTFEELETVAPPAWEPVEEKALPVVEPEPPARPTWLALEEESLAEPPIVEAPVPDAKIAEVERRVAADEDDDEARLELARRLWAAGQKESAQTEYEQLIKSSLLDDVVADLEEITTDEPVEEPMLRLLGDAYMRDNQLKDALATYRRALASL